MSLNAGQSALKISVLLPCYNAVSTLDEALASLVAQTCADFEIIAVDDGSTDGTARLLHSWALRQPRLRLLRQEHAGIIPALNYGLAACQAPYIARMDADDRCHPERLDEQVRFLDEYPQVAVVGSLVAGFPPEGVREGFHLYLEWLNSLTTHADIQREMFVESPLAHPSVTFRKTWVERLGGYQERGWPEDYDLWMRLYLAGAHFGKVPRVLFEWREHPTRLTRTDSRYSLENFLRLKAYYLVHGPLRGRDAVFIWGAGMMGRRIGKQLDRQAASLVAYFDIDPRKIGGTRRNLPVLAPEDFPGWWQRFQSPILLVAVGARGARPLLRARFAGYHLTEGVDWLFVA